MGKGRNQYAVLPVATRDGGRQVLLVTSRETRRWIVPKGWPTKGLSPPEVAAREAFEEAGLVGRVEQEVYGRFCYEKRLGNGTTVDCEVDVFLMHVESELDDWPERHERERRWMAPSQAALLIREPDLVALMLRLESADA